MSMKSSEVIVTFSPSVANNIDELLLVKIWYTGISIFLFKRKESELLFRNSFSSD